jgi:hypothetical protein
MTNTKNQPSNSLYTTSQNKSRIDPTIEVEGSFERKWQKNATNDTPGQPKKVIRLAIRMLEENQRAMLALEVRTNTRVACSCYYACPHVGSLECLEGGE